MMQEVSDSKARADKAASASSSGWSIKDFDLYQKVDDSVRIQTPTGATLSIIGWVAIALLAMAEVSKFYTPSVREHLVVDTSLGKQLRININITFHALTCNDVHFDVMDVAGDNQLNVEHEMMKQRLTPSGAWIGRAGVEIIGEGPLPAHKLDLPADYCGSCYGAETDQRKCCNTCQELINAYQEKQWNVGNVVKNATQCIHERAAIFNGAEQGEGCNLWGSMLVNKVAGNFHVSHGESLVRDGRHIHHFNPATAPSFNISHTIHSLSVGEAFPNMPANPLDQVSHVITEGGTTGLHQYFLRVIPTVYTEDHWFGTTKMATNQYTVSDRFRPLAIPKLDGTNQQVEAVLPGVFFVFEMSPFMIMAEQGHTRLMHLFTKLCAIIGGIFTVLAVVDGVLFRLSRLVGKK